MMFMFDLWIRELSKRTGRRFMMQSLTAACLQPDARITFDQVAFLAAFQCWKDQGFPA